MCQARFGELLGRLVHLSGHDVNEILEEQNANGRPFGEIALSWGLCEPEHIWQAWCDQLLTAIQKVNLDRLGVDSQAAAFVPRDVANRLRLIPIRCLGNTLVVATSEPVTEPVESELELITGKELRFVIADAHHVQRAIQTFYSADTTAA